MKLVRGRRLDDFIVETTSLPDRLRLFLRICDAVAFAHSQGVIHRDLKPSNVMIGDFGEVLVIDWGLAKVLSQNTPAGAPMPRTAVPSKKTSERVRTLHGAILGTPGYMAPEQEHGDIDSIDERTDVYGLGALLRFLMLGTAPKSIQAVSRKASSQQAADRYSTVAELSRDVNCFLDGDRITAYPEGPWKPAGGLSRVIEFSVIHCRLPGRAHFVLLLMAR
jgi:serine/threonine protein kinase